MFFSRLQTVRFRQQLVAQSVDIYVNGTHILSCLLLAYYINYSPMTVQSYLFKKHQHYLVLEFVWFKRHTCGEGQEKEDGKGRSS